MQYHNIQWFPGHMAKALREIEERAKMVDVIIEILDARVVSSSRNPIVSKVAPQKPRLIILSKKDLADSDRTKEWIEHFKNQGHMAIALNINKDDLQQIINKLKIVLKDKIERDKRRGLKNSIIRALVVGIPNVGKSSFINKIAKRKATIVGNKPGVTKAQQWIKVRDDFELLDTPGVLWPKFEDKEVGAKLALVGTMPIDIMPLHELSSLLFNYLFAHHKDYLLKRYNVAMEGEEMNEQVMEDLIIKIGQNRGMLKAKGEVDIEKTEELVLREFKNGILGTFSLDIVGEQING